MLRTAVCRSLNGISTKSISQNVALKKVSAESNLCAAFSSKLDLGKEIKLPSAINANFIYSFPTLPFGKPTAIETPPAYYIPTVSSIIQEILDPFTEKVIQDPDYGGRGRIYAKHDIGTGSKRMINQRRRKVKKHKRVRRERKNIYHVVTKKIREKNASEKAFRERCDVLIESALNFNAEEYVRSVLSRAKEVSKPISNSGRVLHPHWRELMSIEEIYGIPPSTYIDKSAGLPSEEEAEEIRKKKEEYFAKYRMDQN